MPVLSQEELEFFEENGVRTPLHAFELAQLKQQTRDDLSVLAVDMKCPPLNLHSGLPLVPRPMCFPCAVRCGAGRDIKGPGGPDVQSRVDLRQPGPE